VLAVNDDNDATAGVTVWTYDADLHRWARQLCQHRQDAEDVAQTALVKAAEHVAGFRGEASVRTWLHQIVTNECRMLRRRTTPVSLDALLDAHAPVIITGPPPAEPEDVVMDHARHRAALHAIAGLPDRWRTVLLLSDGAEMPAAAVATATGMTVSAVRSVLHRARTAVRDELASG
jgi:RNA polymerase sigma-70 factor (ECF subfamily)